MRRIGTAGRTLPRTFGLLLAALALAPTGLAPAALAPVAHAAEPVPAGTTVRISKLSRQDAFFSSRKSIVGLVCGVDDPGLHWQGQKWYGGTLDCGGGDSYYFYKVAVEQGDFGDYAAITGHAFGEGSEDTYAATDSPWPAYSRVRIAAISPEDAHVNDAATIVGQACTVADAGLEVTGEGWFSGQLKCDNDTSWYFYQVGVTALDAAAPTGSTSVTPTFPALTPTVLGAAAAAFPAGKMVKVVDIAPADALHATKTEVIGRMCSVVESPLHPTGDGWYAGRLFCDDGKSYQVFMAKVTTP